MTQLVAVGKITSPHGVWGWVKVHPLTDDPDRFESLGQVLLSGKSEKTLAIEGVKYQTGKVLLKFEGVDTRNDADLLRGKTLNVPESDVAPIEEEDTYYFYQLEGLEVRDTEGNVLGKLDAIVQTGSNDVYVVKDRGAKKEFMVPALKKCVKEVDLESGVMTVDRDWVT